MERTFDAYLEYWKTKSGRKPLIIRGARQVGKTYTVEQFAKKNYKVFFKINFEENPELKDFFRTNDVAQIKQNIEVFFGKKFLQDKTLLFLDEIQACPEAIQTLRYFYEKFPEIHIIVAGSLLDHALNDLKYSMPVGRVEFAYMYPLDFYEFLTALGEKFFVDYLKDFTLDMDIPVPFHKKLLGFIRLYYFIGGMPEAINIYIEDESLPDVEVVHDSIVKSLEFDFAKYGTRNDQEILIRLLRFIPGSVGKKFKYSKAVPGLRTELVKRAVHLLRMSRIVHIVYNTSSARVPLQNGVDEKRFKTVFMDIGLANHIMKLRLTDIENLIKGNEGFLAEQFIGQQLLSSQPPYVDAELYYWIRESRNAEAEIDFVTEVDNFIIPVEVKAGKAGTLKSLHIYTVDKKVKAAIRFNADYPAAGQVVYSVRLGNEMKKVNYRLVSLPLYLAREYGRLIKKVFD